MRKAMACLLALLMLLGGASAESLFLPLGAAWDEALPLEVDLSADVTIHMPFDNDRCAQLNSLIKHVSLRLCAYEAEGEKLSRVAVRVDNREALWMAQKEGTGGTQLQFSFMPDVTWQASPMEALSLYGLDGSEGAWRDDAHAMLTAMGQDLTNYGKKTSIKTAIQNMGTARTKIFYTVPKDEADVFVQAAMKHCPEGAFKQFLQELTFTGTQKLIYWIDGEERIIRVEYAGNAAQGDAPARQVSLKWRMLRTDEALRDDLTLKTPALKGGDYNTLTYRRDVGAGKKGAMNYESEFSYAWRTDGKKSTLSGEVDLQATPKDDDVQLTGQATVKQLLAGMDASAGMVFKPDLLVGVHEGTPVVLGQVQVQEMQGKQVCEEALISVEAHAGTYIDWQQDAALRVLTDGDMAQIAQGLSQALVPHLALLPAEDALYLSADIPAESWQMIVEAAQKTLSEEVIP